MSNKLYKNYQVNLGIPFQVNSPINFQTIKSNEILNNEFDDEENEDDITNKTLRQDKEKIIREAQSEAELIIKEAQYEALRIVETAENESTEIKIATENEARKRGYEDGCQQAQEQYKEALQEAETIKQQARAEYGKVLAGMENDVIDLIFDIAKKVIGVQLNVDKQDLLHLISQAFEKCAQRDNMILKVSLEDYEYIAENRDNLMAMVDGIGKLEIKCENSLKAGACIVETQFGSVDAGVQTRLRKIEEAFRIAVGK